MLSCHVIIYYFPNHNHFYLAQSSHSVGFIQQNEGEYSLIYSVMNPSFETAICFHLFHYQINDKLSEQCSWYCQHYNPESKKKLGCCVEDQTECLLHLFDPVFNVKKYIRIYVLLNQLHCLPFKYALIWIFIEATCFTLCGTGSKKDLECCGMLHKNLSGTFHR